MQAPTRGALRRMRSGEVIPSWDQAQLAVAEADGPHLFLFARAQDFPT